jgi:phosphoenolpyruvate synthase/pyruvate phosphate dikinase
MSPFTLPLPEIKSEYRPRVGRKGFALAVMARGGLRVPPALCITPEAYLEFVTATGIRETILLELGRKSFEDMRWEEIWDTALRIRNAFLQAPIPEPPRRGSVKKDQKSLEKKFCSRFEEDQKEFALELLDLGRASYRLRDDDNIYMGKIQAQIVAAVEEGKKRLQRKGRSFSSQAEGQDVARALRDSRLVFKEFASSGEKSKKEEEEGIRGRQLVGQPASSGIAMGKARVILRADDLFAFQPGEILVCDAIEPNMTFVVPLAAGIVERRGGMLIHGAIIAREYGIPCVTGIPDATSLIPNGTPVTVDGFLGIVILGDTALPGK